MLEILADFEYLCFHKGPFCDTVDTIETDGVPYV